MQHVSPSPKGIAWTTAGLLLIVLFAVAGIVITNDVAFSSASPNLSFGNGSQLPSQVYQPIPTPTPIPYPTPTPVPLISTPTPVLATPTSTPSPDPAIESAIARSNQAWMASMSCACDQGLEAAKMATNLASTDAQIHGLKRLGEHWTYRSHSLSVDWIQASGGVAQARVSKAEDGLVYHGSKVVRHCSGPYQVQYTLVDTPTGWKVSLAKVLGGGQNCTNGL